MSNGILSLPFTFSKGGAPIQITSTVPPGQVVHANPEDSGGIDSLSPMVVVNPNPNTTTLYKAVLGPDISTPIWHRHDIPSTDEGQEPTGLITPIVLQAGYSLAMYVEPLPGYQPLLLYGAAERQGNAAFFGYGGLDLIGAQTLGDGTLDSGWDTFPFSQGAIPEPVNIEQDSANNRLRFLVPGIWSIGMFVTLGFVSSNSGRTTYVRIFNETKSEAVPGDPMYAGRDQEGAQASFIFLTDIIEDIVDDWFRVEVGGGDTFTGVTAEGGGFNAVKVGDT